MEKSKTLMQRRTQFAVSIRRSQKEKIFRELRQKMLMNNQEMKLSDLIKNFQLDGNSKFSEQIIEKNELILMDILIQKQDNLVRVTFVKNQMFDQKLMPSKNSGLQLEEVSLPKQYSFNFHTALYDAISNDIFNFPQKYKLMPKEYQTKLIDFWLKFLKRNKYDQTSRQKQYHYAIINLLQLLVNQIQSPDLRQLIFSWVRGTEALNLIYNCLPGYFMCYSKYFRVYDIILIGLKHKKSQTNIQSIQTLYKCIKQADFDDVVSILQNKSILFTYLLIYIQEECSKNRATKQYINSIIKAALCVCIFLDTYEQLSLRCALEGAGYAGALLICKEHSQLIKCGLLIFMSIAKISEQCYSKKATHYLLTDASILNTGVWHKIGCTQSIFKNQNVQVRRQFITFLYMFLASSSYDQIVLLSKFFQLKNNEDLIDLIIYMLLQNQDPVILQNTIYSLQSLIFYGGHQREEQIQLQGKQKQGIKIKIQNVVMCRIINSQILKKLRQLDAKQDFKSSCKNPEQIVELINNFIDSLENKINSNEPESNKDNNLI